MSGARELGARVGRERGAATRLTGFTPVDRAWLVPHLAGALNVRQQEQC